MKNKTITKSTPENFIRLETFLWHMCHIISMGISKIIKYILSSLFTEKEQVPLEQYLNQVLKRFSKGLDSDMALLFLKDYTNKTEDMS